METKTERVKEPSSLFETDVHGHRRCCCTCNNSYYNSTRGKQMCRKDGRVLYYPEQEICKDWNKYVPLKASESDTHAISPSHEE